MSDYQGSWITARRKINEGTDWRGTANVSIDGQTHEIGFRLLNESEYLDVKRVVPLSELKDYQDENESDAEERLRELAGKDELTEAEEEELEDLQGEVASMQDQIEDALGTEAFNKILWAGKQTVMPTEDDIRDVLDMPPTQQREILPHVPDYLDEETVEELLKQDMEEQIENQPYLIKFTIGMQAFLETTRVLGNGLTQQDAN